MENYTRLQALLKEHNFFVEIPSAAVADRLGIRATLGADPEGQLRGRAIGPEGFLRLQDWVVDSSETSAAGTVDELLDAIFLENEALFPGRRMYTQPKPTKALDTMADHWDATHLTLEECLSQIELPPLPQSAFRFLLECPVKLEDQSAEEFELVSAEWEQEWKDARKDFQDRQKIEAKEHARNNKGKKQQTLTPEQRYVIETYYRVNGVLCGKPLEVNHIRQSHIPAYQFSSELLKDVLALTYKSEGIGWTGLACLPSVRQAADPHLLLVHRHPFCTGFIGGSVL